MQELVGTHDRCCDRVAGFALSGAPEMTKDPHPARRLGGSFTVSSWMRDRL